ncbi:MAG: hypothetical protein IJE89_01755 [Bacilli bacterium]|nr:hypothetical protein [Bacilli bacterium]
MKKNNNVKKPFREEQIKKNRKKFVLFFIIWICILGIGFVKKSFQNDTFYTIKIGELILNNGIDMMDHFSFHANLAYTYPHWLYDVFIYLCYFIGGYTGVYISSIVLFLILLILVFKTNIKISNNYFVSAFATFICALAISGFATARAQLASFLVFTLQIYFIEVFLKSGKKKYLWGLLLLSLILCNIHVAVWPFYFILYLPYLAEYIISFIASKIKIKKKNKFIKFMENKFLLEKNNNIKYVFMVMVASLLTGLITPIGDTPYTYLIKTMMGNSQDYIQEHQMLSWINSPFTIIIAFETIFLSLFSKVKVRDFFMICGLIFMSIMSTRHLSLLALVGTICFSRLFSMFFENFSFNIDDKIMAFFNKKIVIGMSFLFAILVSSLLFYNESKKEYIMSDLYPVEAVNYIKENIDIDKMKIFNEYNFGSYLLLNDIPVYIDSRADLYTKQFSGFEYDMFDDYQYISSNYQEKFEFYNITHVLLYKKGHFYNMLENDSNYKTLYEDEYFVLYEKLGKSNVIVTLE